MKIIQNGRGIIQYLLILFANLKLSTNQVRYCDSTSELLESNGLPDYPFRSSDECFRSFSSIYINIYILNSLKIEFPVELRGKIILIEGLIFRFSESINKKIN